MKTTPTQFAYFLRILHWVMAVALLTMLFVGVSMVASLRHYHWLVAFHRPLGILILILAVVRLATRMLTTLPPFPPTMTEREQRIASMSERLLYTLMFALPLVGWGMLSAGHYPVVMFGPVHLPPILPASPILYAVLRKTHTILAFLLFFMILAHVAAVLFHTFIVGDGLINRMAFWRVRTADTILKPMNVNLPSPGVQLAQTSPAKKISGQIPGYTYGSPELKTSPVSMKEFEGLKASAGFTEEDQRYLRLAGEVLSSQTPQIIRHWRNDIIARIPSLVRHSRSPEGNPLPEYSEKSGLRFEQWILDTCQRPYDQDWLNYQHEIALRHTVLKKNKTDGVQSTPQVPLPDIIAFVPVMNETIKPYLAAKGHSAEEVDKMHRAWCKSVQLQVALWTSSYSGVSQQNNPSTNNPLNQ